MKDEPVKVKDDPVLKCYKKYMDKGYPHHMAYSMAVEEVNGREIKLPK